MLPLKRFQAFLPSFPELNYEFAFVLMGVALPLQPGNGGLKLGNNSRNILVLRRNWQSRSTGVRL